MNYFPKQVQIFISEVCNEGCAYCPYTAMPMADRKTILAKELTIVDWKKILSFLYSKFNIKLFTYIGGEPTAKIGLDKLFDYTQRYLPGAENLLVTSGIPLIFNQKLLDNLIKAGLRNITVSVDGITETPKFDQIDLKKELVGLKRGSDRKSFLGLYFLFYLRKKYPQIPFRLVAGCIINKKTLDLILPTYEYLAKNQIHLNLCPEQTICFNGQSKTALTRDDSKKVFQIARQLVKIKQTKNNYLIPSKRFLEILPTDGLKQSYRCFQNPFPTTINLDSGGQMPFCNWRRSEVNNYNILDLVDGKKTYQEWLFGWQKDKIGRSCSCSWSFTDRVNDYWPDKDYANYWYQFV